MLTPIHIKVDSAPPLNYEIHLGSDLLNDVCSMIPADLHRHRFVIITDHTVKKLYADRVTKSLAKLNQDIPCIAFKPGENAKNLQTKTMIEKALFKQHMGRDTCLIALGGGVVGDITGFVAATYMRGIPYIQIPTTLLALLDSSIGGKTGINTAEGKNLIGAFWHPRAVIGDLDCMNTLPEKQRVNGWIEAFKVFLTCDDIFFKRLIDEDIGSVQLIKKAIELKSHIVTRDPNERHARSILNFGHTIGHALEKTTGYKMQHGFAVGYGILVESTLAFQRELLAPQEYQMIVSALSALGIEGKALKKFSAPSIIKATEHDKKASANQARYVLLNGIGHVFQSQGQFVHAIEPEAVSQAISFITTGGNHAGK